jgi:hypothetical protein
MFRSGWLTLLLTWAGAAWGQQPAAAPAVSPAEAS